MNQIIKILTVILSFLALNQTVFAADFFSGTVFKKEDQLYLKRCHVLESEYILEIDDPDVLDRILALEKQYPKFWLTLIGEVKIDENQLSTASMIDPSEYNPSEEMILVVDNLAEIHVNETCHVLDLLD